MGTVMAIVMAMVLAGCKSTAGGEADDSYKQAGLGGLVFLYDDSIWTPDEEGSSESSLRFDAGENRMLGVSCSKEGLYQHPVDMLTVSRQIISTYPGYEELQQPIEVEVNGQSWYEWEYRYEEDGVTIVSLQRFFGKNYYAYTISYLADQANYDKSRSEALKVMNSVVITVEDNTEAEDKAKEFLVGEWDMGDAGYLVINEDNTYCWYMDNSMDAANMHTGTYGCDVENTTLGFGEGEGIYLVLFPKKLTIEGQESTTASAKYDYGISLKQLSDGSYSMINASTFSMYQLMKQ